MVAVDNQHVRNCFHIAVVESSIFAEFEQLINSPSSSIGSEILIAASLEIRKTVAHGSLVLRSMLRRGGKMTNMAMPLVYKAQKQTRPLVQFFVVSTASEDPT